MGLNLPIVCARFLVLTCLCAVGCSGTHSVKPDTVIVPRTEYEQLMVSEAVHRGETVYNVALRVDPASAMHAAALQLIRNVLHSCGTLIALLLWLYRHRSR